MILMRIPEITLKRETSNWALLIGRVEVLVYDTQSITIHIPPPVGPPA